MGNTVNVGGDVYQGLILRECADKRLVVMSFTLFGMGDGAGTFPFDLLVIR